jgi:hypothetical protein
MDLERKSKQIKLSALLIFLALLAHVLNVLGFATIAAIIGGITLLGCVILSASIMMRL